MMKSKLILLIVFINIVFASGAYDNGTSTGKGQFQIDFTWNPFDRFYFGQSYAVISYGLTQNLDLHGYISHHPENYQSWYGGLFYQFLDLKRLHLATALGIRRRFDKEWTHLFAPQLLYTGFITERLYFGGSFVSVKKIDKMKSLGTAVDVGVFYQLEFETKFIESISIGFGGFHPATWAPSTYFLPTYSVDFKFK